MVYPRLDSTRTHCTKRYHILLRCIEDIAFCLMVGPSGVNMPLLYGEGANTFIRLQEEILKISENESVFTCDWQPGMNLPGYQAIGILAPSPQYFASSSLVVPYRSELNPYAMTNRGLQIQMRVLKTDSRYDFIGVLHCRHQNSLDESNSVPLQGDGSPSGRFSRNVSRQLATVSPKE
jgi:hypothetical protein